MGLQLGSQALVVDYDATGGRFMVTSDRRNWQVRSKLELLSFAVSPTEPEPVMASTKRRLARSRDGAAAGSWSVGRRRCCWTGSALRGCGR